MATIAYTTEQTRELINRYKANPDVNELARVFDRSINSIRAKLSKERVYVPKLRQTRQPTMNKATLIAGIAVALGSSEEVLESLEKANHNVLDMFYKFLAQPINKASLGSENFDLKL